MERVLVALIALFLLVDMIGGRGTAQLYDGKAIIAELIGALLLVALPFAALWLTRRRTPPSYLLIASSGLEYHGPGIAIASSWTNVETLSRHRGQPALLLHEPAATALSRRYRRDRDAACRVPLAPFSYTDHSTLARELRRYAPQAFRQPATARRRKTPATR